MNRIDFMNQLDSLLQNISPTEREEALQYYNDYFDDAGAENEQKVIDALGNPARVAENIKRDLFGNIGEASSQRAKASDRAVIEYRQEAAGQNGDQSDNAGQDRWQSSGSGQSTWQDDRTGQSTWQDGRNGQSTWQDDRNGQSTWQDGRNGQSAWQDTTGDRTGQTKKGAMPTWGVVLLIVLLVLASPIIIPVLVGIMAALFGIFVGWFAVILAFGVASASLFVALVALIVTGFACMALDPLVGLALVGGGLICGGIGILFLMATVAMAGIVTPAVFRGIGWLFRQIK